MTLQPGQSLQRIAGELLVLDSAGHVLRRMRDPGEPDRWDGFRADEAAFQTDPDDEMSYRDAWIDHYRTASP